MNKQIYLFFAILFLSITTKAQEIELDTLDQKDIIDVAKKVFPSHHFAKHNEEALSSGQKMLWFVPNVGYSLTTGFLAQIVGNMVYRKPAANVSTVMLLATATQNSQLLFEIRSNHWFKDNAFNLIGDWRLMRYPQSTFGLGTNTSLDRIVSMDYDYLRLHQTILKKIRRNLYLGSGYLLDYHWNINSYTDTREITRISRYKNGVSGSSVSSGLSVNLLYDNRSNSINPINGFYANIVLRNNFQFLGSDENTEMLLIDLRKYVHFPSCSGNVLAFWSYNNLTLRGNPPFLDLPSTGWDTYGNVGRGFVQGRFRGKKMLYFETEYRFGITTNRLLGGVIFANAQTFQEPYLTGFNKVATAVGAGLRIKLNKFTRTNLAIDYAFGGDGSKGLFFNLGEVF
jgi:outer membrane protein assembly factor BamA